MNRRLSAGCSCHSGASLDVAPKRLEPLAKAVAYDCPTCREREARAAALAGVKRRDVVAVLQQALVLAPRAVTLSAAQALAAYDEGLDAVAPAADGAARTPRDRIAERA